ncbi:MAG: hypothetical protein U0Z26_18250 [Anaerolineales bacterium]
MKYPAIPVWVKVIAWLLVLPGLFFAFACYTNPSMIFPSADLSTPALQYGYFSTASRAAAMVLVLVLAILSNRPESLALAFIMRLATEIQDGIVSVVTGGTSMLGFIGIVIVLEIACIITLFRVIRGQSHTA